MLCPLEFVLRIRSWKVSLPTILKHRPWGGTKNESLGYLCNQSISNFKKKFEGSFPIYWGCLFLINGGTICQLFGGLLLFNWGRFLFIWGYVSIFCHINSHPFLFNRLRFLTVPHVDLQSCQKSKSVGSWRQCLFSSISCLTKAIVLLESLWPFI